MSGNRHLLEVEEVVAGFVNTNKDGLEFGLEDVKKYQLSFWNCGVGWIRPNYSDYQLRSFLNRCDGVCLYTIISDSKWRINKSLLSSKFHSEKERTFLHNDPDLAKSFDLFCRLQIDIRTDRHIFDWMGYRFIYV